MAAVFQKPLDWLRRFLYNTSVVTPGDLPFPVPVVSIAHDWPLAMKMLAPPNYITIAGNVATFPYQPAEGRHGMVFNASAQFATAIPATDDFVLALEDNAGLAGARIFGSHVAALNSEMVMIGGSTTQGATCMVGAPPVYVPSGWRLRIDHASLAGGTTVGTRLWVLDLPASYPLRLP